MIYIDLLNTASILAVVAALVFLSLRFERMRRDLDRMRMAIYELTKAQREDIDDVIDALTAAGIPLPRPRMAERMRRMALSSEERHAESIARWNEVVAQVEAQWRDKPE